MLVARSDDRVFGTERRVIEHHVEERARKAGFELTSAERITLADYLRGFGPPETQLDAALERLKHDPREEISDLIETAHAVVEADGVMRLQEALFLSSLRRDLAAL